MLLDGDIKTYGEYWVARNMLRSSLEALDAMQPQPLQKVPNAPGLWFWETWDAEVKVYTKKGKGRRLYVTPPGGTEIPITARIAGGWLALSKGCTRASVLHS